MDGDSGGDGNILLLNFKGNFLTNFTTFSQLA